MKHKQGLVLAVAALLALASFAWADADDARGYGQGMMMGGGMMGSGMMGGGMMGYAPQAAAYPSQGLSAQTRMKLIDEQIAFVRNTAQLRTDLAVRRLELEKLLVADKRDTNAVSAKYEEIGNLQYRLQEATLASNSAISKLIPSGERGRYGWHMMDYGMGSGMMMDYGHGYGMMGGYGMGRGMMGYYGTGPGMMWR